MMTKKGKTKSVKTFRGNILHGDALEVLRKLPDKCVQCCVTSPPYWGLRDYGVYGQLGQERTPELYVATMVEIFHEVRRVLKDNGVLWLNLGDTYAGSNQSYGRKKKALSRIQAGNRGSLTFLSKPPINARVPGLKPKDLVGIPWWVAFALRNDGWYLRSDVIWYKPNPMPESVTDRPTKSHEYIFLLTKSRKYYYDIDAIRESYQDHSVSRLKYSTTGPRYYKMIGKEQTGLAAHVPNPKGRNKRSVWIITLKHTHFAHFATFPSDIPNICIRAGSKPGDAILDPFAGSGTTLVEAIKLRRRFLGIELSWKYIKSIILPRLRKAQKELPKRLKKRSVPRSPDRMGVRFAEQKRRTRVTV